MIFPKYSIPPAHENHFGHSAPGHRADLLPSLQEAPEAPWDDEAIPRPQHRP